MTILTVVADPDLVSLLLIPVASVEISLSGRQQLLSKELV